tara:strand:+ start:465 stop:1223 length:759 start_codon:yes stop_codon:yes gene_type:complete
MNWFEIIKENRLSTETTTFTTVDNENKPESDDSRCREALKKKIEYLKFFQNYIKNTSSISDYEVTTLYIGKGAGRRLEGNNLPNSYDHAIEAVDSIPEEACCVLLEILQRCVQHFNSFLNTHWDKPHDEEKVLNAVFSYGNPDSANFYDEKEITAEGEKWEITCRLNVSSASYPRGKQLEDYGVYLSFGIEGRDWSGISEEEELPFIMFDIIFPSQYDKQRQNFDLEYSTPEKEMNTRWDLLRHVVKALELG